jgi:hypothetical protein
MFIPELAVGMCRIVSGTLKKYRAVDMLSRPHIFSLKYIYCASTFYIQYMCTVHKLSIFMCTVHKLSIFMCTVHKLSLVASNWLWAQVLYYTRRFYPMKMNLGQIVPIDTPSFKGFSHEIFTIFWLEWIYHGLNRNHFWFFSLKEIPSILDSQFKYWFISYQPSQRFVESPRRIDNWVRSSPIFLFSGLAVLQETLQRE